MALITQHAEGRHIESGIQRGHPEGLVVGAVGDMGRHGGHGISIAVARLGVYPVDGVRIIAGPDLGEIAEHAQIEAVAAGGTALEEDIGETAVQFLQHAVQTHHIAVGHFFLPLGGEILGIIVREDAVHVPFDVGNIAGGEDLAHSLRHVGHHIRIGKVQNPLVAALGMGLAGDLHDPFGMGTVEVRIGVDHFGLHPDAKLEPQIIDLPGKTRHAAGELFGVGIPVAQGLGIVVPGAEPAVIHDEEFDTSILARLGQLQELLFVDIEIGRLPAVQQNGPGFLLPCAPDDAVANESVHVPAHAVGTLGRIGHHGFGSFECFTGSQMELEGTGIDAGDEAHLAPGTLFHRFIMVAAVDEVEAVAFIFIVGQHHKGIGPVGGTATIAFVHDLAGAHGHVVLLHLSGPSAVEGGEGPVGPGEIQLQAHEPLQRNFIVRCIDELGRTGDHVVGFEDEVMQFQGQVILLVLQGDDQLIHIFVFFIGAGEGVEGRLAGTDHGTVKKKVGGVAAVGVGHLDERLPDVALAMAGHFQAHIFQAKGGIFGTVADGTAGQAQALFHQRRCVGFVVNADASAIMNMLQMAGGEDMECISSIPGVQNKEVSDSSDHGSFLTFPARRRSGRTRLRPACTSSGTGSWIPASARRAGWSCTAGGSSSDLR